MTGPAGVGAVVGAVICGFKGVAALTVIIAAKTQKPRTESLLMWNLVFQGSQVGGKWIRY